MTDGSKAFRSTLALALSLVVWLVALPSQLRARPQGIRITPEPRSWKRLRHLTYNGLPVEVPYARAGLRQKNLLSVTTAINAVGFTGPINSQPVAHYAATRLGKSVPSRSDPGGIPGPRTGYLTHLE